MLRLFVSCLTLQSHADKGVGDQFVHITCLPLYLDIQVVSRNKRKDIVNAIYEGHVGYLKKDF